MPGFRRPVCQLEWVLLLQPGPFLMLPLKPSPNGTPSTGEQRMREKSRLLHGPAGPQPLTHSTWVVGAWACMPAGGLSPAGAEPRQPQGPLPPPWLHACFQEPLTLLPGSRHTSWLQVRGLKAFVQTWDQSNCPELTAHGLVPLRCGCAREAKRPGEARTAYPPASRRQDIFL